MKMHDMSLAEIDVPDAAPEPTRLLVRPWADPVVDHQGHDPRSAYVELFWLPLLGPSATLLARSFARGLEAEPAGFTVTVEEASRGLGLGLPAGRRSPFHRTLARLAQFRLAHLGGGEVVLARRRFPGLTRVQIAKLPPGRRAALDAYRAAELRAPALPAMREQARTLALTLLQVGETPAETEAHLHRLRFHPTLARESTVWAVAHHHVDRPASSD
jgi:hypothetical protein